MSFLDRFRGLRREATQRTFSTTAKKNAPPTFVSDFILEQAWDRDEVEHQGKMSRRSAAAWNITTGIANNVFDDGFYFVDPQDDEKRIMQDVLLELERMQHLKWLSLALAGERAYGHTWLYVGEEELTVDGIEGPARVANLDAFTPEYCTVTGYDDIGAPSELTLKVLTNAGKSGSQYWEKPIPAADCILFRTRPYDRSHEGTPSTYPVWNALVGLELIFHAITTYSGKMGLGALILTTKGTVSAEDKSAAEAAMEDLSVSRVGVIPGKSVESLEFKGASGTTIDFPAYINVFREEIAAGSKIPVAVLIGSMAGAITGSEVNSKALYAVIQGEQSRMDAYIRELVKRMGNGEKEYKIKWNTRYATDEMQQAQIRVLNAQADESEQRIEQMKQGNSPNDINIRMQEEKPKEQDKDNNPAGKQ